VGLSFTDSGQSSASCSKRLLSISVCASLSNVSTVIKFAFLVDVILAMSLTTYVISVP